MDLWRAGVVVLLAGSLSGCALLHARAPQPEPALEAPPAPAHDVPPPSPRPLEPTSPVLLPEPPPSAAPQPAAADRTPPPPPPPRPAEPTPATPEVVPPSTPATTLQTTPDVDAAARKVRSVIDRASRDLGRVNYWGLGADGKTQYDTARRFIQQAEAALGERNVAYATQLADKAAALAAVLPKG